MTTFETISITISLISMVVAAWGIMSAMAAKRSARAAETQAEAAIQQAKHAETQARAAETQVELMRSSMAIDKIGTALKGRRAVVQMKEIVLRAANEVKAARGSREVHAGLEPIRRATAELQDFPPVYPANVRAMLFGYTQDLDAIDYMKATEPNGLPTQALNRAADLVVAAMDVAINASISKLKD